MATFMDVHSGFFGVTSQQLAEAHQADLDIERDEGVHFERAWHDMLATVAAFEATVKALETGETVEVGRMHS